MCSVADNCLMPAIITIASRDELEVAYEFLVDYGANALPKERELLDFVNEMWEKFQPPDGTHYVFEGSLCLRIDKDLFVNHSGDKFYHGEFQRMYNHGDAFVKDDMMFISVDEYIYRCTGMTTAAHEFEVEDDNAFLTLFG